MRRPAPGARVRADLSASRVLEPPAPARAAEMERGSVTAEAAVVLPVLLVVLALAVWVLGCVSAQLRCTDAAAVAARAAARGESAGAVTEAAWAVAPVGAQVRVGQRGAHVEVVVHARVQPLGAVLGRVAAV